MSVAQLFHITRPVLGECPRAVRGWTTWLVVVFAVGAFLALGASGRAQEPENQSPTNEVDTSTNEESTNEESTDASSSTGADLSPDADAEAANPTDATNAPDSTGFQWQWVRDERFHVTATQMIKETVPIGGQSVELPVTLSVEADWTVLAVDGDGMAEIDQVVTRLRFEAKSPFLGEILVDTQTTPAADGMTDLEQSLRAAVGTKWRIYIDRLGRLTRTSLGADATAPRGGLLDREVTAPEQLQLVLTPLLQLNGEELAAGQSWTVPDLLAIPVMGQGKLPLVFTYVGPVQAAGQTLEKFEVRTEASMESPAADQGSTRATGADASFMLRETKVTGTALFDSARGFLSSMSLRSTLSVAAEVEGMVTDSKVTIDSSFSARQLND